MQLVLQGGHFGPVGGAFRGMLEAEQVHGRTLQCNFQGLAVEHHIELGRAVLMGAQAAMLGMLMVMRMRVVVFMRVLMGLGESQR